MNFQASKQRTNDSGSSRETEAIFEVKTCTVCKSRYAHNNIKTASLDRHARMIMNVYSRNLKKLVVKFVVDVVGDEEGGIKGPFETAHPPFI